MSERAAAAAITVYRRFPKELFRVNAGWRVQLRPKLPLDTAISSYDIITNPRQTHFPWLKRTVEPKALDPETYARPNGAMLRTNTPFMRHYVSHEFKGKDVIVYSIQEGTRLPEDLLLVKDLPSGEQWSLQPAAEMTLEELNEKITNFLLANGAMMTRRQWTKAYPKPTEPRGPAYPLPIIWRIPRVNPEVSSLRQKKRIW